MDEDAARKLEALRRRIEAARKAQKPKPPVRRRGFQGAELAWRMIIDLASGIGLGFGMGYGLDSLIGTLPVFTILLTLLGFAAGLRVMKRSADEYQHRQAGESPAEDEADGPSGRDGG
ncbi:MAG: AtpZ/AtpI family protein [Alphaproteobacteria bacterium]|nr:MAG: AtpZ/AtpI family protein [Alphaproteobacteria bacterium]